MNPLSGKELAEKLADFGLTINQATVYLSVVRSGTTSVDGIAQDTSLYRQDIYKMMPKLQKMGLITKILGKPAKFEALPIEKALGNLLEMERKEAEEKIIQLSANLKTLTEKVQLHQTRKTSQEEEPHFSLLTTDLEIKNKFDAAFEKARKEFCIVTTPKIAPRITNIIRERANILAKKGVETRVIIESSVDEVTRSILDKLDIAQECLMVKQVTDATLLPYRIIDGKEVWITLKKETASESPWFLWTDSHNIVRFYKKNFEKLWKSPAAKPLYSEKGPLRK